MWHNPIIKCVARNNDANARGDMFGGWLMGQMDIAGAVVAYQIAQGEVATRAVEFIQFKKPILIGDGIEIYAEAKHIGNTSISVALKVMVHRRNDPGQVLEAACGEITYVAISEIGKPKRIVVR